MTVESSTLRWLDFDVLLSGTAKGSPQQPMLITESELTDPSFS
jgi:hypothetical protein